MIREITTAPSRYDTMTEEQLMQEMKGLRYDDYFTIAAYIQPRLTEKRNIEEADRLIFDRYHTYGDCR